MTAADTGFHSLALVTCFTRYLRHTSPQTARQSPLSTTFEPITFEAQALCQLAPNVLPTCYLLIRLMRDAHGPEQRASPHCHGVREGERKAGREREGARERRREGEREGGIAGGRGKEGQGDGGCGTGRRGRGGTWMTPTPIEAHTAKTVVMMDRMSMASPTVPYTICPNNGK